VKPSREFFIQQATLTTLHRWYPTTIEIGGIKTAAEDISPNLRAGDYWGKLFQREVWDEMKEIENRYIIVMLTLPSGRAA